MFLVVTPINLKIAILTRKSTKLKKLDHFILTQIYIYNKPKILHLYKDFLTHVLHYSLF